MAKLLNDKLFDSIRIQASQSPRHRMHYDLRSATDEDSGWQDQSQRILNVLQPDTEIPIHRHNLTSETVIILRGHVQEVFFDSNGNEIECHDLLPNSKKYPCGIQVPRGMWHTVRCITQGSVIFEAKDRPYDPITTEDIWQPQSH